MKEIYLYLMTVPVFFGIDMIWLGFVASKFYKNQIGQYLKETPNWPSAILFYLIYIVGILVFVVLHNIDKGPLKTIICGAIFGLIAYATYDLTNYSTMKGWPLTLTIVDLIWGTTITGLVAIISHYIAKWIF